MANKARLGLARLLVAALLALSAPLAPAEGRAETAQGLAGAEVIRGLAQDGAEAARVLLAGREGHGRPISSSPPGAAATAGSLEFRVSVLEVERRHLATKADVKDAVYTSESRLEQKIDAVKNRLEQKIDAVKSRLEQKIEAVESRLQSLLFWVIATILATGGFVVAALSLILKPRQALAPGQTANPASRDAGQGGKGADGTGKRGRG